jgi:hypothetical protein
MQAVYTCVYTHEQALAPGSLLTLLESDKMPVRMVYPVYWIVVVPRIPSPDPHAVLTIMSPVALASLTK